jgi:tetratricopeptide (TPR) repeat protein
MLVETAGRAAFDLSHEKVRRVVLDDTSLARRRLLHRRTSEYLERTGDEAVAAFHAQQAGRDADAARLFARAGERARALFAHEEALAHLGAAIALGHPSPSVLHEAIGDIQTLVGRYPEAMGSYEAALAYVGDPGGSPRIEARIGSLFLRRGESERAEHHLRRAIDAAATEDSIRSAALADLGLVLRVSGSAEVHPVAEAALASAESADDPEATAHAHNLLGLVAADRGDAGAARSHLRIAIERAGSEHPAARAAALNNLALVERDDGRSEDALELLSEALELCRKQGDLHRAAALHNNLADVLHDLGRDDESRAHSVSAAELFARVGEDPVGSPGIWKLVSW